MAKKFVYGCLRMLPLVACDLLFSRERESIPFADDSDDVISEKVKWSFDESAEYYDDVHPQKPQGRVAAHIPEAVALLPVGVR
jgi:hypothetical protein